MESNKLILYIRTIRHLRLKQLYYQLYYRARKIFKRKKEIEISIAPVTLLRWNDYYFHPNSYQENNTFEFLNITHCFSNTINWNYSGYGKLWTYNLNYFEFLNQKELDTERGISLIKNYIKDNNTLLDGLEPYPMSLRGINWIKFLNRNKIHDQEINKTLFQHYLILSKNIEYHLLANHLLENGFSLYFAAYFFKDEIFYELARSILLEQLKEQVLEDGAHFELSPMYHQIVLYRLLDCINLSSSNKWDKDDLLPFLKLKALKMLGWLEVITFSNGNIPMVNDSTYDIAPSSKELFHYAKSLNLKWNKSKLTDSGYRKFSNKLYELFLDVGNIGPSYQPGHAHSDTLSFELYKEGLPIMVDTGISTYEKNDLRNIQRSTESHNTVRIGNIDQSQVWGGFRVGSRAKIISLKEKDGFIEASHNGYKQLGLIHTRSFEVNEKSIVISDTLSKATSLDQNAYLHFHPDISEIEITDHQIKLLDRGIMIKISNANKISKRVYNYALGFNLTKPAVMIEIQFEKELKVVIDL